MSDSFSIGAALEAGRQRIHRPMALLAGDGLLLLAASLFTGSGWLIGGAFFVSVITLLLYWKISRLRWQVWAFNRVRNVHQLQRSAELAGLLPFGRPRFESFFAGQELSRQLGLLQAFFERDDVFEDDPAIPAATAMFRERWPRWLFRREKLPAIVLSNAGIGTPRGEFIPWGQISDERIALKGSPKPVSTEHGYALAFSHPGGHEVIYVGELSVSVVQLDLLLYLYRGRYETGISSSADSVGIYE